MRLNITTKALLIAVSGTVFQWYDFALFGYFATIIAATYFADSTPSLQAREVEDRGL